MRAANSPVALLESTRAVHQLADQCLGRQAIDQRLGEGFPQRQNASRAKRWRNGGRASARPYYARLRRFVTGVGGDEAGRGWQLEPQAWSASVQQFSVRNPTTFCMRSRLGL